MLQHLFLCPPERYPLGMHLRDELQIRKDLTPGHEVALSLLLTREYVARLFDEQVFKREDITDQQFNVLRILKGGPEEGYLIRDIRARMIYRNADVPRLVDRLTKQGLVERHVCPHDRRGCMVRLTPKGDRLQAGVRPLHDRLCDGLDKALTPVEVKSLLGLLERLRDDYREKLEPDVDPEVTPKRKAR